MGSFFLLTQMDKTSAAELVIQITTITIIVIFIIWMLILLFSSNFESNYNPTSVSGQGTIVLANGTSYIPCQPGDCATNIETGMKTCPSTDTEIIHANPVYEVCNGRYTCDNQLTPFALLSDGSTNFYGQCETGVECACLKQPQCADYILSAFTASNGNPYSDVTGQRLLFPQIAHTPPIQTTFCTAPVSWLPLATPGCNFIDEVDEAALRVCMGLPKSCNGALGDPCLQGVLAVISTAENQTQLGNINSWMVGCVRGQSCPCGQLTVFDTGTGSIICLE